MTQKINSKLISWASDIDPKALEQAEVSSTLPFIFGHIALMPDAHWGLGATVGSVIPTLGAIIPAAVGVDIGCGMIAVETSLTASDLPDDLKPLLGSIQRSVPAGVGQGQQHNERGMAWLTANPNENVDGFGLETKTCQQFGSLGSGNHFIEVCLSPDETVWVVLHSGSRGVGNMLARHHIAVAKGIMSDYFIELPDPDLAYLVEGRPEFDAYMTDLMWAQNYALANRERMMDAVLRDISFTLRPDNVSEPVPFDEVRRINCHHNYTAREHHRGKNIWVTRKGAIRAREGDYGVIPGSMGTNSYIVRGLGNPSSWNSSAHGAGRRMSRGQAKKEFTVEDLAAAMEGKTWLEGAAGKLLDEIPGSYKDIEVVMRDQADLVAVETELHQILNYKGT
ncbi:MAG: RtcB family protein [Actinomycetota bacterium]